MTEDKWTRQLAPVLTGRAEATYNDVEPRAPYAILKQAILRHYEINPEPSQVKLQQMRFKIDDDIAEHVSRVDAFVKRWLILVSIQICLTKSNWIKCSIISKLPNENSQRMRLGY